MVFREEHCQAPLIFDVARTPVADLYRFAVESASVSTLTGGKRDFLTITLRLTAMDPTE